jgi:hypothetical protein
MGGFFLYVGEQMKFPSQGKVIEEGLVHTEKEASDRLSAYMRRHQLAQIGKRRQRATTKARIDA